MRDNKLNLENQGLVESKSPVEGSDEQNQASKDVDLTEPLLVLWRQKLFCVSILIGCVLMAVLYILITTPLYRISCQIRPGITSFDNRGRPVRSLRPEDLRAYFTKTENWISYLPASRGKSLPGVVIKTNRGSDVVGVSFYWPDPAMGKTILEQVIKGAIKGFYGEDGRGFRYYKKNLEQLLSNTVQEIERLKIKQKRLTDQIARAKSALAVLKAELDSIKKNRNLTEQSLKKLEKQLDDFSKNTRELFNYRHKAVDPRSQNTLSLLIYLNTVQQNIAYLNNLQRRIEDLRKELNRYNSSFVKKQADVDNTLISIGDLKIIRDNEIIMKQKSLEGKVDTLKSQIAMLSPLEVISPPTSSSKPAKPRKKLILLLGVAFGVMLAIFLGFVRDFLTRNKEKSRFFLNE